jgi:uncharacterized protein DUF397
MAALRSWRQARGLRRNCLTNSEPTYSTSANDLHGLAHASNTYYTQPHIGAPALTEPECPCLSQKGVLLLMAVGVVVGVISVDEPVWRTASRCDSGACVEIGKLGKFVMVRKSPDPDGARLKLSLDEWQEFIVGLKAGKFDGL